MDAVISNLSGGNQQKVRDPGRFRRTLVILLTSTRGIDVAKSKSIKS
jgi:ABC-type sugar transport system ATPase subunit